MKPLGLKAWTCGEKKKETKLEGTFLHKKRRGREENGSTGEQRQQWLEGE